MATLTLSAEVAATLDRAATDFERSRDEIVADALALWLDREAERHGGTLRALAQADAGQVISHEDMLVRAEEWKASRRRPIAQAAE